MSLLLNLAILIPCAVNLSFSVCAVWCFHKYPRPPGWVIVFLLILGAGTIRLAFMGAFGYTTALITMPSAILCIIQALAMLLRRYICITRWKSWGIPLLIVLPVVIWIDLRFSILVVDANGTSVEVDTRKIELQAQPRIIFYRGYGNRLKKGVIYFGFCQWVQQRENWTIWGDAVSPEGVDLRAEKIYSKGDWGNWPLRVTIDPQAP